jgi:hypothetical protein
MKLFLTRDRIYNEEDDPVYLCTTGNDITAEELSDKEGKPEFNSTRLNESNYPFSTEFNILHRFNPDSIISEMPRGSAIEIFHGPYLYIKEYCKNHCLMGKDSDYCTICPLNKAFNDLYKL